MTYAILRTAKLKGGSVGGSGRHVSRQRETPNADAAKTDQNVVLAGTSDPAEDIGRLVGWVRQKRSEAGLRRPRSDSVEAVEHVHTASPEFFEEMGQQEVREWAQRSLEWAQKRYGKAAIAHATLHLDESTPHLHLYHVPIAKDRKVPSAPALACKRFYGGSKTEMSRLQDSYADAMQQHYPTLKRGVRASRAQHNEIGRFYQQIQEAPSVKEPNMSIETPPRMLRKESREEWAQSQTESLRKRLRSFSSGFKKVAKAARHYKRAFEQERARTAAYAEISESPEELRGLKRRANRLARDLSDERQARMTAEQRAERLEQAENALEELSGRYAAVAEACGLPSDPATPPSAADLNAIRYDLDQQAQQREQERLERREMDQGGPSPGM